MGNPHETDNALGILYRVPPQLRHWDGKPAAMDPTRLVLSLKPRGKGGREFGRKRVMELVAGAGLQLADTGLREQRRRLNRKALSETGEMSGQVKKDLDEHFRKSGNYPKDDPDPNRGSDRKALPPFLQVNESDCEFFLETPDGKPIKTQQLEKLERIFGDDWDWIGPVFDRDAGSDRAMLQSRFCPLPRSLVAELLPDVKPGQLEEILSREKLAWDKLAKHPTLIHLLFTGGKREHVYGLRDDLRKKYPKVFRSVRFENMPMLSPQQMGWNYAQTKMGPAPAATFNPVDWPVVPVVVIDRGVEFKNHYGDIPQNKADFNHWNAKDCVASDGAPVGEDHHGTSCAGIIAHISSHFFGMTAVPQRHPVMSIVVPNFTDLQVATALTYCASDPKLIESGFVINLSASDAYGVWDPSTIDPAVDLVAGIQGILCVSAGNEGRNSVNYPANRHSVIAVAATDQYDRRVVKPTFSWGSNYGYQVAAYAPGVKIPTLDLNGPAGVSDVDGPLASFHPSFEGTSAATPHVAALAAMIIRKCRFHNIYYDWEWMKYRISKTGDIAKDPEGMSMSGFRRIHAQRALDFHNQTTFQNP